MVRLAISHASAPADAPCPHETAELWQDFHDTHLPGVEPIYTLQTLVVTGRTLKGKDFRQEVPVVLHWLANPLSLSPAS